MRIVANYSRERIVGWFKSRYRNIGSASIEKSVYNMYLDCLLLDIQACIACNDPKYFRYQMFIIILV